MLRSFVFLFIVLIAIQINAQNEQYARKVLDKLTSSSMRGRGYVKQGDKKAADYIARQFKKNKLNSFGKDYFQHYNFPINTFPGKVEVIVNDKKLKAGVEYVVSSSSPSINGTFNVVYVSDSVYNDSAFNLYLEKNEFDDDFLVINGNFRKHYGKTLDGIKGIVQLTDKKPWWHMSNGDKVASTCWIKSTADYFPADAKSILLNVENKFIEQHQTQNVIAYIKGKTNTSRYVVFTAHYDHLGMMGNKTFFPGANDNGSGTAMLLDLAAYYSKPENQPEKSIVFMAFSGEEAGLHGSTYYADHPVFPLKAIDFLINLDMVGTGSEGITIVNGKAYKDVFDDFTSINDQYNYVPEIKARGEACNSDHCPFYKKGVKSIFIYTRGNEHTEYHTVFDTDDQFPFTVYKGLFELLTTYVSQLK